MTLELLLRFEAIGLVFGLSYSVANTVGKQFEIFASILLRQAFEQFVSLHEPIVREDVSRTILPVVWDGLGGLAIFGLLGAYDCVQWHQRVTDDDFEQWAFIGIKTLIALAGFGVIVARGVLEALIRPELLEAFGASCTLLIFGDVLLVLVSMRYTTRYRIVFRNFSFALATVLIRLALVAPPGFDALLGVGGMLYALAVSILDNVYNSGRSAPCQGAPSGTPAVPPATPTANKSRPPSQRRSPHGPKGTTHWPPGTIGPRGLVHDRTLSSDGQPLSVEPLPGGNGSIVFDRGPAGGLLSRGSSSVAKRTRIDARWTGFQPTVGQAAAPSSWCDLPP